MESLDVENVGSVSPKWIKPNDILKLRKKSKRLQPRLLQPLDQNVCDVKVIRKEDRVINPFRRRLPGKRDRSDEESESNINSFSEFPVSKCEKLLKPSPITPDISGDDATQELANLNKSEAVLWQSQFPTDWSLKTKVTFLSAKRFPWNGSLRTTEEASGTSGFVRCLHMQQSKSEGCNLDTSPQARFHQQCLYWIHPWMPWLELFPRHYRSLAGGSPISGNRAIADDASLQESLKTDWVLSFRSLYQLLRARQCPYFYLCAHNFTVLFRAAGVGGIPYIHALITPTTRGLRQALQEEGISYSMPLCEVTESGDVTLDAESQSAFPNSSYAVEDNVDGEEEAVQWLESLGLNKDDFPALNLKKSKLERKEDKKPRSMVYVHRENSQALFNFLLNSKMCVSVAGPMAGIPPTLLSPVGFHGATLRSLKTKLRSIRHKDQDISTIELKGPILPNALSGICNLFSSTQEGTYSLVAAPHTPTAVFNLFQPCSDATSNTAFATESLTDCGLSQNDLQSICILPDKPGSAVIEVKVDSGKYFVSKSV